MRNEAAPDPDDSPDGAGRLEVSGTQVAASVLASVSAAVVASFFGVAGTIVGAAVVSVVATIGSAAYSLGIRRTTHRINRIQTLRPTRPFPALRTGGGTRRAAAGATEAPNATADTGEPTATDDPDDDSAPGWRAWLAERRWGVAAGVALVFVISLGSVTLIELVGDQTLARETSGSRTSIGALLFGDGGSGDGGAEDESDDGTGTGDPSGTSETVPDGETTTSQPDDTTTTTATAPSADSGEPFTPSTSTTSTTTPTTQPVVPNESSGAPVTTIPGGQAAPPPAPTTVPPAPIG